jgi:hypothetical protein
MFFEKEDSVNASLTIFWPISLTKKHNTLDARRVLAMHVSPFIYLFI